MTLEEFLRPEDVEVVDDVMARVYAAKTGAERLEVANAWRAVLERSRRSD